MTEIFVEVLKPCLDLATETYYLYNRNLIHDISDILLLNDFSDSVGIDMKGRLRYINLVCHNNRLSYSYPDTI